MPLRNKLDILRVMLIPHGGSTVYIHISAIVCVANGAPKNIRTGQTDDPARILPDRLTAG
jgi:hypothetical protein